MAAIIISEWTSRCSRFLSSSFTVCPENPKNEDYISSTTRSRLPSSETNRFCFPTLPPFVALLAIPVAGQIRLHDASNDELARKTRDAFAEFSKGDANVFDTMLHNTVTMRDATLSQLYQLNRQGTQDTANLIPFLTWKQLRDIHVPRTQNEFRLAYNAARLILDPMAQGAPDLKATLAAAQAELGAQTKKKKEKTEELESAQPKLKNLHESLEKLKDAVAASDKPIKKLSDFDAEFNSLKSVWSNMAEVKAWWDAAENASNVPGLQLSILDLGVKRQQTKVARLKLEIEQVEAARKRAERLEQRLLIVWNTGEIDQEGHAIGGMFGQIFAGISQVENENEQVLQTIGRLAIEAKEEVGKPLAATMRLRDLLDILGRYISLAGYQKYLLLSDAIDAGVDEHLFSIRRSALNTKEREMLVAYGLDGLAAYHAGGLRPEEIANFFRAAQSIALGVLAGRGR